MNSNNSQIYLERIDASKNMARFYRLSMESDLFGTIVVIRCWGRIGSRGLEIHQPYWSLTAALEDFMDICTAKRRRGYLVSRSKLQILEGR